MRGHIRDKSLSMPPRFTVLSDPIESIVTDGAQRGWANVLFGVDLIRKRGNETMNYVYSDTFSHRLAHVAETAMCPRSPLFFLLALTVFLFLLKIFLVQNRANRMIKKYSHVE